jgi:hypothetical protein
MKLFIAPAERPRTVIQRALFAGLAVAVAVSALTGPAAHAAPPAGDSWVVSVGDSYISGEAGRWAGNSSDAAQTDALGDAAYFDAGQSESTAGCHRSSSAEIRIGQAQALSLSCSGAKTATWWNSSGQFKPGLDFYSDVAGNIGQALALQNFASTNRYCKDSTTVATNFSAANRVAVASRIGTPLANVAKAKTAPAMRRMSTAWWCRNTSHRCPGAQTFHTPKPDSAGKARTAADSGTQTWNGLRERLSPPSTRPLHPASPHPGLAAFKPWTSGPSSMAMNCAPPRRRS